MTLSLRRLWFLGLCLCLWLAAGLRFYRLDAQSFWNDEGNTARLVERPVSLILEGAAGDIHPPGYYLLLHAWRAFTGESEFALRGFSALCGVVMAALAARVGRAASGRAGAVGAALWTALHPLAVYYGQEARMYALLGAATLATVAAAITLAQRQRAGQSTRGAVAALGAAIALGLYTQYAYAFVLVGLNLAWGGYWLTQRRQWRDWPAWIAAHGLGGLAFLPWAGIAWRALGWRPPDLGAADAPQALTRALLAGVTLPDAAPLCVWAATALLALALLTARRERFAFWAAAGVALTPPLLIAGLGLYRPAYLKFLLAAVGPLGVLLAAPLSARRKSLRLSSAALLLALMPVQVTALHHLYHDPAYARADYRGIAARVAAQERPGDAILLSAPNQWEVFTYYYRGPAQVYPAPYRPTAAEAADWVTRVTASHERLWVLFWGDGESDPERLIEPLLARHAYKAGDEWVSTVRLARYGGAATLPEAAALPLEARFGDGLALEGYALDTTLLVPGDILPLTLFWRTDAPPGERLKVFVHLLDAEGRLAAQTDAEPGGGFALTDRWAAGERRVDRYGVALPDTLAPGLYTVWVGLYRFSGERLPISLAGQPASDALRLAEVEVRKLDFQ